MHLSLDGNVNDHWSATFDCSLSISDFTSKEKSIKVLKCLANNVACLLKS